MSPFAERAEHRIAERVNHHIAVRVRHHAAMVRNAHAAEHDVIAVAEGMHVEPLAYPHPIGHLRSSALFNIRAATAQIRRARDLDIERRALHQHAAATPSRSMACASSVTVMSGAHGLLERVLELRKGEHLRRQRAPQSRAIDGLAHRAVALALDGIDDRARRARRRTRPPSQRRRSSGAHVGRAQAGARGIVHQHPILRRGEARRSSCRPFSTESWRLAAADGGDRLRGRASCDELAPTRIVRERSTTTTASMRGSASSARSDHSSTVAPAQRRILLGRARAAPAGACVESLAASRGGNDGPDAPRCLADAVTARGR